MVWWCPATDPAATARGSEEAMTAKRNTTTDGACPSGIAKLLGMAMPGAAATEDDLKADLLELLLASGPEPARGAPSAEHGDWSRDALLLESTSLADVLLDGTASLADLRAIKDHHKKLSYAAADRIEQCVNTAIYFAAIASALLQHARIISHYSPGQLADAFGKLAGKTWMSPELAAQFARAREIATDSAPEQDA